MAAGLTQLQLADLIGTRQSVIARLEDAEYRGHSLTVARIAEALHSQLEVVFVPAATLRKGAATEDGKASRLQAEIGKSPSVKKRPVADSTR